MAINSPQPIYAQLLFWADGKLKNFREDLTKHDFNFLCNRVEPGETYLWMLHKNGTHLVRWDCDPYSGTKQSFPEALVRSFSHGAWPEAQFHLIQIETVTKIEPYGYVSQPLDLNYLNANLPRPKPSVALPGEKKLVTKMFTFNG